MTIPDRSMRNTFYRGTVLVGLPIAIVMAAAMVARAYDTTWISSGQPVSANKLKVDLDEAQARLAALETSSVSAKYDINAAQPISTTTRINFGLFLESRAHTSGASEVMPHDGSEWAA